MSCSNNECSHRCGNGYVLIIVLYVLLAIILGSWITY
ncbi:MAG: YjcZ family sporulation protein [bacterium]|nr:YjcZ family sporulation protein [bacterium]